MATKSSTGYITSSDVSIELHTSFPLAWEYLKVGRRVALSSIASWLVEAADHFECVLVAVLRSLRSLEKSVVTTRSKEPTSTQIALTRLFSSWSSVSQWCQTCNGLPQNSMLKEAGVKRKNARWCPTLEAAGKGRFVQCCNLCSFNLSRVLGAFIHLLLCTKEKGKHWIFKTLRQQSISSGSTGSRHAVPRSLSVGACSERFSARHRPASTIRRKHQWVM